MAPLGQYPQPKRCAFVVKNGWSRASKRSVREMVRSIFKRLDRLEVQAAKVALVNSKPHIILFVDMQKQPISGIRWDRAEKRYLDVDLSTLRWDADKNEWMDD
jgi:hypothetical protein